MSLTPEQLEERRHWIGASETPCLLDVSPHGNAHSVWAAKMGLAIDEPTVAKDAGNYIEPALAKWYRDETGFETAGFGSLVHPRHPFMGCTPDLLVRGQRRIAQIKNVGMWMAHHWEDDVPEYVQVQVQHEMEVVDADVCDVVALIGGTDFRILPIERDREIGQYLVEVCRGFFEAYIATRTLPPPDDSEHCRKTLRALYERDNAALIPATAETDRIARAWLAADERLGEVEKERTRLTNEMKAILGESLGIDGDFYRVRWALGAKARTFTLKKIQMRKAKAA